MNTWIWCDFCRMNAYDRPTKGTLFRLNKTLLNSLTIEVYVGKNVAAFYGRFLHHALVYPQKDVVAF